MRGYERVTLIMLAPLVILLISVMYFSAALVDSSFGDWTVGIAFVSYGIGYYFSNQALDLLNALGMVTQSARTNALGSLVCLGLVLVSTLAGWGLVAIVFSYALATVFQFILAMFRIIQGSHHDSSPARGMKLLLQDGGRLLGLNLGQSLTYRADTVLLGAMSAQNQVGLYAVATTPAGILRIPANALGQIAFHQAASGSANLRMIYQRIALLLGAMVPLLIVGWIAAEWLFVFVFGVEYRNAAEPFRVLLLAELALAPFLVLGRTIAGRGGTWGASACGIAGVVVLVISAVILIPRLGATGAAWASVFAYAAMSLTSILVIMQTNDAEGIVEVGQSG